MLFTSYEFVRIVLHDFFRFHCFQLNYKDPITESLLKSHFFFYVMGDNSADDCSLKEICLNNNCGIYPIDLL